MKKGIASFDADIILLRDLLSTSHVIPDMQRNYEWQTNTGDLHVDKLWNSFWDFHLEDLKQEDVYYTGTMISFPEGKKSSIIDGQQRLTTISLMFFAMRDLVEESTIKSNSTRWACGYAKAEHVIFASHFERRTGSMKRLCNARAKTRGEDRTTPF